MADFERPFFVSSSSWNHVKHSDSPVQSGEAGEWLKHPFDLANGEQTDIHQPRRVDLFHLTSILDHLSNGKKPTKTP